MKASLYNNRVEIDEVSPDALAILKRTLKIDYYRQNGRRRVFEKSINLLEKVGDKYRFPPGMINYVDKKLSPINEDIYLDDERSRPFPHLKFKKIKQPTAWVNQRECLEALAEEDNEVGFVCGVTGSGKSRIIEDAVTLRSVNTLIIVPREAIQFELYKKFKPLLPSGCVSTKLPKGSVPRNLMDETKKAEASNPSEKYLEDKGFNRYGSNWLRTKKAKTAKEIRKETKANIVIICYQSLSDISTEALDSFEHIIVDEGHTAKNNTIRNILSQAKNAYYRLFLSATMWAEVKNDMLLLMSSTSDNLIYEELPVDTIKDGRIKKPNFLTKLADKPDHAVGYWRKGKGGQSKIVYTKDWDEIVKLGLVGNNSRNVNIVNDAIDLMTGGNRVLVCIHEEMHGHILQEMFADKGIKTSFIFGRERKAQKRKIIEETQTGEEPHIFIGTGAVGLGVDTKNINSVILADVRKSSVVVFQFIGRALRATTLSMEATIINYIDWFHPKLKEHSLLRERMCGDYYSSKDSTTKKKWSKI
jgi:superfamily II DNA or RNA helicase